MRGTIVATLSAGQRHACPRRHLIRGSVEGGLTNGTPLRRTHSEPGPRPTQSASTSVPFARRPEKSRTDPVSRIEHDSVVKQPPAEFVSEIIRPGEVEDPQQRKKPGLKPAMSFRAFGKRGTDPDSNDKSKKTRPTFGGQFRSIFTSSWLQLVADAMLALIPAGFAVYYCNSNDITVFFVNFFAIVPSAIFQGLAADELGLLLIERFEGRLGDTLAGLLNVTFSNAVQLITSCLLLKARQIGILRSSLLGSILTNLLLTTGLSFFVGGLGRLEQYFNPRVAQTVGMLLLLAVLSLIVPVAAHSLTNISTEGIREQSRGTAILIMISYVLWLFFQLKFNRQLFEDPDYTPEPKKAKKPKSVHRPTEGETIFHLAALGAAQAAHIGGGVNRGTMVYRDEDDEPESEPEPSLSWTAALLLLIVSTTLIAFNTEFATNSIQGLLADAHLSATFIGLIILPLLSVDLLSISPALLDKMDLSISLTLERCMQTALMVVPLVVLVAWWAGIDEMNMEFDTFPVLALFASIVIVTYVVQEGRSNWLTGALLIKIYLIIALAAYYIR